MAATTGPKAAELAHQVRQRFGVQCASPDSRESLAKGKKGASSSAPQPAMKPSEKELWQRRYEQLRQQVLEPDATLAQDRWGLSLLLRQGHGRLDAPVARPGRPRNRQLPRPVPLSCPAPGLAAAGHAAVGQYGLEPLSPFNPSTRMSSDSKVTADHLKRIAYLYIRQSTLRQVFENTESTHRQYDLRQRAIVLGWPEERIVVIDCDQAHSGDSAVQRDGFQYLVGRSGAGASRPGHGTGGFAPGAQLRRLAPVDANLRADQHADPRPGRALRSQQFQRPLSAGPQGDDERSRVAHSAARVCSKGS